MDNPEYNKLIINGRLDELASTWNTGDLTRYKYLKRYLLEYLLEQGIHKRIMDNYAIKKTLWISLYIKYGITTPILNAPLNKLLETVKKELLLETLLKNIDDNSKIVLFNNLKKNSYWLLRYYEPQIISIYAKYGITIEPVFLKLPLISEKKITTSSSLQTLITEFTTTYKDIDQRILDIYINEFKNKFKINKKSTYSDLCKLIIYKRKHPGFKLTIYEYDNNRDNNGEYDSNENKIIINWYRHGTFDHELSHMLYDTYEANLKDSIALIKFFAWLEDELLTKNRKDLNEYEIGLKNKQVRESQEN